MKIFLIGLPGSGKTTIGKQLATRLQLPFVDLDVAVEKSEKRTVKDIFSSQGENYFRKVESEVLKKWCSSETEFVMATGGGAPVFFDNMKIMNESGKTVFLDVPASEIATRILKTNLEERPLFARLGKDELKDKIEFLRSHRAPFYNRAQFVLIGNSISVSEICDRLEGESQRNHH